MTYFTEDPAIAVAAEAEARDEFFDALVPGWEHRGARPEYRRFIDEGDVALVSEAERAEYVRMLDTEAWEGMGS